MFTVTSQTIAIARKVVLGVVFPLVLLRFDPFLLGGRNQGSLMGAFSGPIYVAIFLSILAFIGLLFSSGRMARLSGILSGAVIAGSLLSALLGSVLLPFSITGIRLYGLGLLGLYPWVVSILYFQAGRSAMRGSGNRNALWPIVGFIIVVGVPLVLMGAANRELDRLAAHAGDGREWTTTDLRPEQFLTWAGDSDRIVGQYEGETTSARKENLGRLYGNLTGQDIEARLERLRHPD